MCRRTTRCGCTTRFLFAEAIQNEFDPCRHSELVEGMDAVATGVSLVIGVAYLALPPVSLGIFAHVVACCLVAACLAFLPANWPTARLFLGDGGSNLLGFVFAFLALDFYRSRPATPSALLFPLLVAALPLSDAVLAALRRLRAGRPVLFGDRRHLYDRMRAVGWSVPGIAITLYAVSAVFAGIGLYGVRTHSRLFWPGTLLAIFLFLGGAIRLGSLRCDAKVETNVAAWLDRTSK